MKYIVCEEPQNFQLKEKEFPIKRKWGGFVKGSPCRYMWYRSACLWR